MKPTFHVRLALFGLVLCLILATLHAIVGL